MTDKILVIGSNSFSGSTFIKYALDKDIEVIGVSRSPEEHGVILPHLWSSNLKFYRFFQYNLNNDLPALIALIKKEKFKKIYNFAAQSMVGQSWDFPEDWIRTNVYAFSLLIKNCSMCDFLDMFVHITTPEVYGSTDDWIEENTHYNPSTPYAVSRAAADMLIRAYIENQSFPAVLTRAANVYGPGQQLYRVIPRTIFKALNRKKLELHGGGLSERSFIYMDDVAEATMLIAEKGKIGDTYHISTENTITIRDVVKLILDLLNLEFEENVEITEDRKGKDKAYKLNSMKLRNEIGWKDKTRLSEGIEKTINWVKKNIDELKKTPEDYIHKK